MCFVSKCAAVDAPVSVKPPHRSSPPISQSSGMWTRLTPLAVRGCGGFAEQPTLQEMELLYA